MRRLQALSLVIGLASTGCMYKPPAIPIVPEQVGLEALVGEWTGDYAGDDEYERSGRITFTLIAGEDHAHGDVLLVPSGNRKAYERYQDTLSTRPEANRRPSEALRIRFVRVFGGGVSGLLDPYWDPDRNCRVSTTFVGDLRGDVIQGTFRSHFSDFGREATGHWRVTRARVAGS